MALLIALLTCASFARNKTPYRSTKLIELQTSGDGFCFIVQLDDLAYIAIANDPPSSNLIVGDQIQVKLEKDAIRVMTNKKWPDVYPDGSIKAKIAGRQRMSADSKLPSCSLSVKVH